MTDEVFWSRAGFTLPSGWALSDRRTIYDPVSQRWLTAQIDFDSQQFFRLQSGAVLAP